MEMRRAAQKKPSAIEADGLKPLKDFNYHLSP